MHPTELWPRLRRPRGTKTSMSIIRKLLQLLGGRKANVAIIFGLSLPLVVGGAGLGVETSYWYFKDLQLQAAADVAAYAAAIEKRSGSNSTVVAATATSTAVSNGFNS